MTLPERIEIDPRVKPGKPVIRRTGRTTMAVSETVGP
jgi:uncharacterized protein (DUF433 family)